MKNSIIFLIAFLISTVVFAQHDTTNTSSISNNDYLLIRDFLRSAKDNPGIFSTNIKPHWNSKLFNDQYNQLLSIDKKKEFYPELLFDSRFAAQSIPTRYSSQNYIWVSTQHNYTNLGEQIVSDVTGNILSGLINSKKQHFNVNNRKGYYTPAGLKY